MLVLVAGTFLFRWWYFYSCLAFGASRTSGGIPVQGVVAKGDAPVRHVLAVGFLQCLAVACADLFEVTGQVDSNVRTPRRTLLLGLGTYRCLTCWALRWHCIVHYKSIALCVIWSHCFVYCHNIAFGITIALHCVLRKHCTLFHESIALCIMTPSHCSVKQHCTVVW